MLYWKHREEVFASSPAITLVGNQFNQNQYPSDEGNDSNCELFKLSYQLGELFYYVFQFQVVHLLSMFIL